MGSGSEPGGIFQLFELIEEHPAEFAYDFRSRFNLGVADIGNKITWLEALQLTSVLLRDPSSWLQAAFSQWRYPVSHEWMLLANIFDLHVKVNSKNPPKPYTRPWPEQGAERSGKPAVPESRVREVLNAMRPEENDG